MIVWKDPSNSEHRSWAEIAGLALCAAPTGHWLITPKDGGRVLASGRHPACSLTAAKADAEAHAEPLLREMHAELAAHFAPVLRWQRDMHSVGTIDGNSTWVLEADSEEWSIWMREGAADRVQVLCGHKCTTREANRCAAEAAMRRLGVSFRVEEDGAQ